MAVIECVFNYNENTGEVSLVTHVMTVDVHDTIHFVTQTPSLTLSAEADFPLLNLRKGDLAPIRYTSEIRDIANVPEFKVYYHGDIGKFACGELDGRNAFYAWPRGVGQDAPGGH